MELNEAARRIFGRHWQLILIAVALCVAAAALLHSGDSKTYTASTRLVLDTPDPQTTQESAAIADAAKAIATSPGQVSQALKRAHVRDRDPKNVADKHVSVRALGTSAVLQLSVSDRNPRTAAMISNALADEVIRTRLTIGKGQVQTLVGDLDQKIAALNRKIASVDVGTPVQDTQAQRDTLTQRRAALESERVNLLSDDAARPTPSIISSASTPSHPDSSRALPDMILAALLGLVIGVGLAGLLETVRPTLVGRDALAREFDTPVLGTMPGDPDSDEALEEASRIAMRLKLAAGITGARSVGLLAAGPPVDLTQLAQSLEALPAETEPALAGTIDSSRTTMVEATHDTGHPSLMIRPLPEKLSTNGGGVSAVVLVAPTALKKSEIIDTNHFLKATRLPVLGLITYRSPRRSRTGRTSGSDSNGHVEDTA
jgi:capsular polysaccharide biosynthesis protein